MALALRLVRTLTAGDRTEYRATNTADSSPESAVFILGHGISLRSHLPLKWKSLNAWVQTRLAAPHSMDAVCKANKSS